MEMLLEGLQISNGSR